MPQNRTRLRQAVGPAAGFVIALAAAASGIAQSLDSEVVRLLDRDCRELGMEGGTDNGFPVGPNLDAVCRITAGGGDPASASSTGGGGAAGPEAADVSTRSQRALDRLEEERDDGAAAAVTSAADLFDIEGLGVWLSGDFTQRDREITSFEDGYESDTWSGNLGLDYRFADFLISGLAFNYQHVEADYDAGGGFDTDSYAGVLYGSLTPTPELFVDAAVGYGRKDYEVDRAVSYRETGTLQSMPATIAGIASSDTDGEEFSARAIVGYVHSIRSVTLEPRAGINFVYTQIDGVQETGGSGLDLVFEERTRQSLQSVAGLSASMAGSMGFGVLLPQLEIDWIHEFQDDQRHHSVYFVEDLRTAPDGPLVFRFENEEPDRDFFRLGVGVSMVLPQGVQLFALYRTMLGHSYLDSQGISVGARFELGGG